MVEASKGTPGARFSVKVLTVILGLLFYWLLNFVLDDLASTKLPDAKAIQSKYISQELLDQQQNYKNNLSDIDAQNNHLAASLNTIKTSADNLKTTIDQMLELQKASLQKNISVSTQDKDTLTQSQAMFLKYQAKFQEINNETLELQKKRYALEQQLSETQKKIDQKNKLSTEEYFKLYDKQRFYQAVLQVTILMVILLISLSLTRRYYDHNYILVLKAFDIATIVVIGSKMMDYFPARFFKYILIIALISVFIYFIIRVIKSIKSPKVDMLIKLYKEAYEQFLCPMCEFPIRMGPRKFLYWTRKSNINLKLPKTSDKQDVDNYFCPSCGTELFSECKSCHKVKHALLPHCSNCGVASNEVV